MAQVMVFSDHLMKGIESELSCLVMALINQSCSGFTLNNETASFKHLK
tara:strand:- start:754 stop:897 length:144 start_codon:yes stop_codon:yes gene_type:complete